MVETCASLKATKTLFSKINLTRVSVWSFTTVKHFFLHTFQLENTLNCMCMPAWGCMLFYPTAVD